MKIFPNLSGFILFVGLMNHAYTQSWIRINQLGYPPKGKKIAVFCSKQQMVVKDFQLVETGTGRIVLNKSAGKSFGIYGPFQQTYRLNFSMFTKPGRYFLKVGRINSPGFIIGEDVYAGTADFCLRYMRQQRSGFNPFLNDSCHTHDGYTLYAGPAGMPDSTFIDVVGGWHDASDYLQYASTSANAVWHLLAAYRDFPAVFGDEFLANGLKGKNNLADVLDEARWGLDWLLKMHPNENIMFNQIGDDRDHIYMRIPKQDSQYKKGLERPVYFIDGHPQQRGNFLNSTQGTSSTAAKFASAFNLGSTIYSSLDRPYSHILQQKAFSAYAYALKKPGNTQTVSVLSPYIYAEENWADDMELAAASAGLLSDAERYARMEPVTPWLGGDTAKHYQWYPFVNLGHYELGRKLKKKSRDTIISYYRTGILRVWAKAHTNAFYHGIPFIWCSNNLTTSFALQCLWYRLMSHDPAFEDLEQANFDWLFGCNPWGTSMVYGLPAWGDFPIDPHSAFTHIGGYPIDGGLVDGPVNGNIYGHLIGILLTHDDEYKAFQSSLAVYHDDYGDYSTNEPTMDGTATLIYLLASREAQELKSKGAKR